MERMSILVQVIGFIGVAFFLLSYQVKSNKKLFAFQTVGSGLFCLQFFLLGAYSGCLSLVVSTVRNVMMTRYNTSKIIQWNGWVLILSAAAVAVSVVTWNGLISLLPVAGTISTTIAFWTNNAKNIRIANLAVNSPCMLIYDVLVKSWGGVLNESITIISIVISIMRFGWKALDGDTIK